MLIHFSKVKLWKENPRKNDEAVPRLMELLQTHGQVSSLIVRREDNIIYKGNTTYKALVRLIREWTIFVTGQNRILFDQLRKGFVKVEYQSFPSANAASAYAISDNRASEFAVWDDDVLNKLMKIPEIAKGSGFTAKEASFMNMSIDKGTVEKIHASSDDLKERIIIVLCNATVKIQVRDMLIKFVNINKLSDKVVIK
jgi:hypothetical protein